MVIAMEHMPSIKSSEIVYTIRKEGTCPHHAFSGETMNEKKETITAIGGAVRADFFFDDFDSHQNETSTCKNDCHKSHRMVVNPRYHTQPVPYSMNQYANEDFLRNRKPKKMIEFSCLKLSFIIILSTAIGFGTAALIFYITVSSCSINTSSIPNTLETTESSTLQPGYNFSWGTQVTQLSTSQEPTTMAQKSEQLHTKLSFQRASKSGWLRLWPFFASIRIRKNFGSIQ